MSKTAGRWEFFPQDLHPDDGSFYFEFVAGILKKLHITEGQELETSYYLNIQDTYFNKMCGHAHFSTKNTLKMVSFMHALIHSTNIYLVPTTPRSFQPLEKTS